MNTFFANIALVEEQIAQVVSWISTQKVRTNAGNPNVYWITLDGGEQESVIVIGAQGVQFQCDIVDAMLEGDTVFGLSKEVFYNVLKNQKWKEDNQPSFHKARIPEDPSNFVDIDWTESSSSKNREWYETEKIWKDRVYTFDLLCERLAGSLTRRYETLEDGLNHASSGLFEHHKPISIRMIIEHLNDVSTTEMVKDLLLDTANENKARIERIREFKRKCAKINE